MNHWARADAANGTGAEMYAAYSTVQLGVEAYRRFGADRKGEEKTAQAKHEFHIAIADFAKTDPKFKKARAAQQKVRPALARAALRLVRDALQQSHRRWRPESHATCSFRLQEMLQNEVARQVALLSIKLQLIAGVKPEQLSLK